MCSINFRHKLNIFRREACIIVVFLLLTSFVYGQQTKSYSLKTENLPNYDQRLIHYGFFLGGHSSHFRLRYSDRYLNIPNLHSVVPTVAPGFNLGFIVNLRLAQYLDFRLTPMVGLHQYALEYNAIGSGRDSVNIGSKEAFYAGVPLLLKYKSQRRDNFRMYIIGGLTPTFEVSSFEDDEQIDQLLLKRFDVRYEIGFGVDIYFPLFKFSPEVRYSHGMLDMLRSIPNSYSTPLERLTMHNFSVYLQFQ